MRTNMINFRNLAILGFAAATLAMVQQAVAADQLTVVNAGGAYQAAVRKVAYEPFVKTTGIQLKEDEWSFEAAKIKAMVDSKTVSWDVVETYTSMAMQLCEDGLIERIDWKKLGLDRSKFAASDILECGVPSQTNATVLAYDRSKLPSGPKAISDLFDTLKFPGKRGLWRSPIGNLEWALIADGVAPSDLYNVLRTPAGVERAFKKLDTIKKDVIWWTAGSQPPQLLADGQVVMTAAYNGRIYDANKNSGKRFEIVWDKALAGWSFWVIPKGTQHRDAAYKFIAFAASPEVQANLTKYIPYGPANKDAMPLVDPATSAELPNSPVNIGRALPISKTPVQFWMENGDELRQRFNTWLAK